MKIVSGETEIKRAFVGGTKDFLSPETLSCYVIEEGAIKERTDKVGYNPLLKLKYTLILKAYFS